MHMSCRGGELIAPVDVEDALMQMPGVKGVAAFSTPHAMLQEVVGVLLVLEEPQCKPTLPQMHSFLGPRLHPSKWPMVVVYAPELPMGPTGKVCAKLRLSS